MQHTSQFGFVGLQSGADADDAASSDDEDEKTVQSLQAVPPPLPPRPLPRLGVRPPPAGRGRTDAGGAAGRA
jgi:hypothetical protein